VSNALPTIPTTSARSAIKKKKNLQLGVGVVDGVGEDVERAAAGGQERTPPPVVVFAAELEVAHHNRDLQKKKKKGLEA
jgi:hypothetical protein